MHHKRKTQTQQHGTEAGARNFRSALVYLNSGRVGTRPQSSMPSPRNRDHPDACLSPVAVIARAVIGSKSLEPRSSRGSSSVCHASCGLTTFRMRGLLVKSLVFFVRPPPPNPQPPLCHPPTPLPCLPALPEQLLNPRSSLPGGPTARCSSHGVPTPIVRTKSGHTHGCKNRQGYIQYATNCPNQFALGRRWLGFSSRKRVSVRCTLFR